MEDDETPAWKAIWPPRKPPKEFFTSAEAQATAARFRAAGESQRKADEERDSAITSLFKHLGGPTAEARTAQAAEAMAEHLAAQRADARAAERREVIMLRWTIAGVVLAGVAAVASIVGIVIAVA